MQHDITENGTGVSTDRVWKASTRKQISFWFTIRLHLQIQWPDSTVSGSCLIPQQCTSQDVVWIVTFIRTYGKCQFSEWCDNFKSELFMYKCTPGVRATTPKMTDDAMFLNHRFIFQSPHKVPWRRASTKYGKRKNPWLHNSTFRLKAKNIGSYGTT